MATRRKRYFKVADKVLRKAWSNDELASLVRLMAYLNQRWARDDIPHDEAGYAEIGINDLMTICGKRRPDVARTSAERWINVAEISVQHRGDVTVIFWPKFSEFQDFRSRSRGDDDPYNVPSASASDSASNKEEKKKSDGAPAPPTPQEDLSVSEDHSRLLNLLSKADGDLDEKRAWLSEEGPVIEADVEAGVGTWKQLTIRYYRSYLRGQRRHKEAGRDARVAAAARAAEEADRAAACKK